MRAAQGTDHFRFEREGAEPSPLTAVALRRVGRAFNACPDNAVLRIGVLREARQAGLDAARLDQVRLLAGGGVTDNPRISVQLVQDQDGAITFSISTLEE